MPVFNRAAVLPETIRMVLDQSFTDYEFIIYNDGSKDQSADIVRAFHDPRIQFIDKPNLGPPHPLNAIYERARGEFVIILHDHDFFDPTLIAKSVATLDKHPEAGFVLQGSAWIDEDGVSNYREMLHDDLQVINNGREIGEKILMQPDNYSSIFHACCMVRRSALEKVGMHYAPELGLYADGDLWLRLLCYYDFIYLNEVLFKFRTRESQGHFLSNRQFEILKWLYEINQRNILLYFQHNNNAMDKALAINRKKYNREQYMTVLYALIKQNKLLFDTGIQEVRKNKDQGGLIRVSFAIIQSFPIKNILWFTIPRLYQWQKALRKK